MNNLLIVTQNFSGGGLETQITGQVRALSVQNWGLHLACGRDVNPEIIPSKVDSAVSDLPIDEIYPHPCQPPPLTNTLSRSLSRAA